MEYEEFVELYDRLAGTTKKLEKSAILAEFLNHLHKKGRSDWIYLLRGRVLPDYDTGEFGISTQLAIKAIANSFGIKEQEVIEQFNKVGDLGDVAEYYVDRKRQRVLFSKRLSVEKVFETLRRLISIDGKGAVERKLGLISELLTSASGKEAKYIIRTLLSDLRVGVADALLVDALAHGFFENDEEMRNLIEEKYDLANDFAVIFGAVISGKKELEKINLVPGRPINVMLAVKVENIEEAFKVCGKPAVLEYKYDGFRILINKDLKGNISLFTRRLENVTNQFPDVVDAIKENVRGENFILDSEVVGFDPETKKYRPFEAISKRIKRKYDINQLMNELPVEINVFDLIYFNGKNFMNELFIKRRELLEKIVVEKKRVIRLSRQIITDNEKKAEEFYEQALSIGEEGVMFKKIDAPYKPGRRVGYMVKLKPVMNDLDLVIVGAEYGTGKRAGWLTSYIVACKDNGKFLEVGKVSSGLKEKEEEGTSYEEITKLLKPLIVEAKGSTVRIKPKLVMSVTYQNIQRSSAYSSGYALRFPRITAFRPDRGVEIIASLKDIEKEIKKGER
ncbi:MAG: ATP-dependent DNA ligase [Nanoarchaeota archaeon]